jgi:hypothetical protein
VFLKRERERRRKETGWFRNWNCIHPHDSMKKTLWFSRESERRRKEMGWFRNWNCIHPHDSMKKTLSRDVIPKWVTSSP